MECSDKGRHETIDDVLGRENGVLRTVDGQSRRRTGTGNEGRNRTDGGQGWPLHEREREGQPRTEHRLLFDDMGETTQSATGTTKDIGNPDDSMIDMVGEEEITR